MKKNVVIIGAGPAGLTAGYELLKKNSDYNVILLEEEKNVGGISKTINYKGNRMDLGGHRFFSKEKKVNDFWHEIMPVDDGKSMLIRKRVSRIYYKNKFFDYPVSLNLTTIKNLGFIQTFSSGLSYLKSCIFKKKENNLENFYINRFGKKLYSIFLEGYTEKLWGRKPKEISANWGYQRVKGLSIKEVLIDCLKKIFHIKNQKKQTSLIEKFEYPAYGPGQLWEKVAKKIEKMGGKIFKNSKVIEIGIENNKIKYVKTKESSFNVDILISSMPLKDLVNAFNIKVPNEIYEIANGLPYRDFVTLGLLLKKIKLKNKNINELIPDCWIYVQDTKVKLGRIQIFNNWSPYLVKDSKHSVWLGLEYFCEENDNFWNMSEKECANFVIKELVKLKIIDENDVIDYHREKVKKAYPAYFDTYDEIESLIKYLNKVENLYCIGRNGQHRYNNMDHSMLTAFESVDNILKDKKNKNNIWNVNTEEVYHEIKDEKNN